MRMLIMLYIARLYFIGIYWENCQLKAYGPWNIDWESQIKSLGCVDPSGFRGFPNSLSLPLSLSMWLGINYSQLLYSKITPKNGE